MSDLFNHYCHCGKWGSFGVGDRFYCGMHQPRMRYVPQPPPSPAIAAKQAAMAQVEENADEEWRRCMLLAVKYAAERHRQFTSDDVFDAFHELGFTAETHEPRALGPVMIEAAKNGWCRKANCAPWPSRRMSLHASPRAVWDSLIYREAAA